MLNKISLNNTIHNVQFKGEEKKPNQNPPPKEADDKTKLIKMGAVVFCAALAASGGFALVNKIIGGKSNEISSLKIKKGEISDELFYFLKRFKKNDNFINNLQREDVIALNNSLNETNFSQFKKLAKKTKLPPGEITEIVKNLNENNLPFLDSVVAKLQEEDFDPEKMEVANVIKAINEKNKEFASRLIEMAEPTYTEKTETTCSQELINILNFVDEKNRDALRMALSVRKQSDSKSKLKLQEIKELTNFLQHHKKPLTTEFFGNLQARNGAQYRLDLEELKAIIEKCSDDYIDLYQRAFTDNFAETTLLAPKLNPETEKIISFLQNDLENSNSSAFYVKKCLKEIDNPDYRKLMKAAIEKYDSSKEEFNAEKLSDFIMRADIYGIEKIMNEL